MIEGAECPADRQADSHEGKVEVPVIDEASDRDDQARRGKLSRGEEEDSARCKRVAPD